MPTTNVGLTHQSPYERLTVNSNIVAQNEGVLGAERVTNGSFATDTTGWTIGDGWIYNTSGSMQFDSSFTSGNLNLEQNLGVLANECYRITVTVTNMTQGFLRTSLGGVSARDIQGNGTYTFFIRTSNTGKI